MKDHAKYLTDAELKDEIAKIKEMIASGKISEDEEERNAYFSDPANAAEIAKQQAQMDLIIALYQARKKAGLTQKQLAEKLGMKQAYIAQIETGKKNITFSTLTKYAIACGKKVAITLL